MADEVLGELEEKYGFFKISDLTEGEVQNCLVQLVTCPSINDYHVGSFLSNVSYYYPKLALQFFIDRIGYKSSHPNLKDYDPLPLSAHEGFLFRIFSETSEYENTLQTVRNWCFIKNR